MKKRKKIDRNNYDPVAVLDALKEPLSDAYPIQPDGKEARRLLEESAHAYLILRDEARRLFKALQMAETYASDKITFKILWPHLTLPRGRR